MADPFYMSVSDRPAAILQAIDNLSVSRAQLQERYNRRKWLPLWLFLAGFPILFIDFFMGYNYCTFTLVALGLWTAFLVTLIYNRATRPKGVMSTQLQAAREVIHTLRDDLDPGKPFFGHIDLTGTRLPDKLTRSAENARGRKIQFYRDEWLSLKAKLYDGNVLRISVIERAKVRKGYFKKGSSGKMKWRSEDSSGGQELKVRISVNPDAYNIVPRPEVRTGMAIGSYQVTAVDTTDGILQLSAAAGSENSNPQDLLWALRWAYYLLERKRSA